MNFTLIYEELVVKKDIPSLGKVAKNRVKKEIEKKLITSPEIFGKPLRKSLKAYRKMRCGYYRVIFKVEKNKVRILLIAHRSIVYKKALERLTNNK